MSRIGIISDTQGLLRPQALNALAGCMRILHGGDIGGAAINDALAAIAPVKAAPARRAAPTPRPERTT